MVLSTAPINLFLEWLWWAVIEAGLRTFSEDWYTLGVLPGDGRQATCGGWPDNRVGEVRVA